MISSKLLYSLLFLLIGTINTKNLGLQTRKGFIVGRETENTVEYLG